MEEEFFIDKAGRVIFKEEAEEEPVVDEYIQLVSDDISQTSEEMREQLGKEMLSFVQRVHNTDPPPSTIVFLDKSARPAYWFFDSLWNELYSGEKHPEIKFINIGQEKTGGSEAMEQMALFEGELFKAHVRSNEAQVNAVRQHFQIGKTDKSYLTSEDDIWIVDEHSSTGTTLLTAEALFEAAFGSRFYDNIQGFSLFSQEPPWISINQTADPDALGVVDRKPGEMAVKPLSPVPQAVNQLKHELKMLAHETALTVSSKTE